MQINLIECNDCNMKNTILSKIIKSETIGDLVDKTSYLGFFITYIDKSNKTHMFNIYYANQHSLSEYNKFLNCDNLPEIKLLDVFYDITISYNHFERICHIKVINDDSKETIIKDYNKHILDEKELEKSLNRNDYIYDIKKITKSLYHRMKTMRENAKYSQISVEEYDRQIKWLENHLKWFRRTGEMSKIYLATDKELKITLETLMYINNLPATQLWIAKDYQLHGAYIFKEFEKFTYEEQSAISRLNEKFMKITEIDLTEIAILMKQKFNNAKIFFTKDENDITQVSAIIDENGNTYSIKPKKDEYCLYEIFNDLKEPCITPKDFRQSVKEICKIRKERNEKLRIGVL